MTRKEKIAAGWTPISTATGEHWRLPDGPAVRDETTGYGWGDASRRSVVRATADGGFAVEIQTFHGNGWSGRTLPLAESDGSPVLVTPAMREARSSLLRMRAGFLRLRRDHALLLALQDSLVSDAARETGRGAPLFHENGRPVRVAGSVLTWRRPLRAILAETITEAGETREAGEALARLIDATKHRYRETRSPVAAAARRARQRAAYAALSEEKREAKRAKMRERARERRAAAKRASA